MRRLFPVAVLVAVAALSVMCSPFDSNDAPRVLGEADGGGDGPLGDGSASIDATDELAADSGTFCATQVASFCADFDRGLTLDKTWTAFPTGSATVGVSQANGTQGSNALQIRGMGSDNIVVASKVISGAPQAVVISYDVQLKEGIQPDSIVAKVTWKTASGFGPGVALSVDSTGSSIRQFETWTDGGVDVVSSTVLQAVAWGTDWHHVELVVNVPSSSGSVTLDGVHVDFPVSSFQTTSTTGLWFAVDVTFGGAEKTILIDNIVAKTL